MGVEADVDGRQVNLLLKTLKVRLYPTQEQEKLFHSFVGCSKFVYNYVIRKQKENYEQGNKFINYYDFKKLFTQDKKEHSFLLECSNQTLDGTMRDAFKAYENFFDKSRKKLSGYPKYRTRYEKKFYTRYDKVKFGINLDAVKDRNTISRALKNKPPDYDITKRVYFERIGWVKVAEPERFIGINSFKNPRVKFDGKYWYLTVAVELHSPKITHTEEVLGVDLGVKELAIVSNGSRYANVNKSVKMQKIEKRKKRLQRQSSRKYQAQQTKGTAIQKGEKFKKSNNQKKLEAKIAKLSRKQANTRRTHICQAVTDLVKTHPRAIVVENLNVVGMLKNGKLAQSIQEQTFGAFLKQAEWKCTQLGIELIKADRFYPSSKTCNSCGYIHKELKLSDRIFKCPSCGYVKDRDENAADNLRDYGKLLLQTA